MDNEFNSISLLYETLHTEMRLLKELQWKMVNYTILSDAALISALALYFEKINTHTTLVVTVLLFVLWLLIFLAFG